MDDQTFNDPKTAQDWISLIEKNGPRDQDIYPRLAAWVKQTAATEILEIGSGQGVCSDKIDLTGRHYTGVEPCPILLGRSQYLYPEKNRKFLAGNAYALPLRDRTFDAIFTIAVFHLLSDLPKAASEMCRILKPGGHFLIITANPDAYSVWTDHYSASKLEGVRFEGALWSEDEETEAVDVLYLHPLPAIRAALADAKLVVEKIEAFREVEGGHQLYVSIQGRSTNETGQ